MKYLPFLTCLKRKGLTNLLGKTLYATKLFFSFLLIYSFISGCQSITAADSEGDLATGPESGIIDNAGNQDSTATLWIKADAACSGQVTEINVLINGTVVGSVLPGGSLTLEIAFGRHTITGKDPLDPNKQWDVFVIEIDEAGKEVTFTCNF